MKFTVITIFPQLIENFANEALLAQARKSGLITIETLNPRQFTHDVHQTVDDKVFGGGDGMVMKAEPLNQAVSVLEKPLRVVVLSPQGRRWTHSLAKKWAHEGGHVALVCGRYAGIDHRFTVGQEAEEISLGDFILCGGEIAACAIVESVARLRPGFMGNKLSPERDSFADGLLECPQFTRPREISGLPVPAPLLSGHHAKIAEFEKAVSLVRTALLRPDLLPSGADLKSALKILAELKNEELRSLGFTRDNLSELA